MHISFRPGFLPDPNDGSLYVLGGKHQEGLMVRMLVCVIFLIFKKKKKIELV